MTRVHQMLQVVCVHRPGVMGEQVIPMGFKEFLQLHIGELDSLGQTVHPSLDLDIDMILVD